MSILGSSQYTLVFDSVVGSAEQAQVVATRCCAALEAEASVPVSLERVWYSQKRRAYAALISLKTTDLSMVDTLPAHVELP